jgi:hypothetical protein
MIRLRAGCVNHCPLGWAVTPRMWIRRMATCMTNSTYKRRSVIVSMWKKSAASNPDA